MSGANCYNFKLYLIYKCLKKKKHCTFTNYTLASMKWKSLELDITEKESIYYIVISIDFPGLEMTIAWFLQVFQWLCEPCAVDHYMRLHRNGRSGHSLRWNGQPLKCIGFPVLLPIPFSPVQRARKFSAVLGTTSAKSSNTIRPAATR